MEGGVSMGDGAGGGIAVDRQGASSGRVEDEDEGEGGEGGEEAEEEQRPPGKRRRGAGGGAMLSSALSNVAAPVPGNHLPLPLSQAIREVQRMQQQQRALQAQGRQREAQEMQGRMASMLQDVKSARMTIVAARERVLLDRVLQLRETALQGARSRWAAQAAQELRDALAHVQQELSASLVGTAFAGLHSSAFAAG